MKKDEPNIVIPLVASWDTRGQDGYTQAVTNGLDQRKVNTMYQAVRSLSGKTTLELVNRPGVSINGNTYGATGQVAHLISLRPSTTNQAATNTWIFVVDGNDVEIHSSAASLTVVTAAGYAPVYVDLTSLSGTENLVLVLRNASGAMTTWYSTAIAAATQITDADYTGLALRGKPEFGWGFMFHASSNDRINQSDANSLANWTAGVYVPKNIQTDTTQGLMMLGQQVICAGYETMEVFTNNGNSSGSVLSPIPHLTKRIGVRVAIEMGALPTADDKHYYAEFNNRLYFVGLEKAAVDASAVYVYDGNSVETISPPAINAIIAENGVYHICVMTVRGETAIAFALTTTAATTQRW